MAGLILGIIGVLKMNCWKEYVIGSLKKHNRLVPIAINVWPGVLKSSMITIGTSFSFRRDTYSMKVNELDSQFHCLEDYTINIFYKDYWPKI